MQHYRAFFLDAAALRKDLAAMEKQIQLNRKANDLINRYLAYFRKVREIEYREKGYVTARNQPPPNENLESRLLRQVLKDSQCCLHTRQRPH